MEMVQDMIKLLLMTNNILTNRKFHAGFWLISKFVTIWMTLNGIIAIVSYIFAI